MSDNKLPPPLPTAKPASAAMPPPLPVGKSNAVSAPPPLPIVDSPVSASIGVTPPPLPVAPAAPTTPPPPLPIATPAAATVPPPFPTAPTPPMPAPPPLPKIDDPVSAAPPPIPQPVQPVVAKTSTSAPPPIPVDLIEKQATTQNVPPVPPVAAVPRPSALMRTLWILGGIGSLTLVGILAFNVFNKRETSDPSPKVEVAAKTAPAPTPQAAAPAPTPQETVSAPAPQVTPPAAPAPVPSPITSKPDLNPAHAYGTSSRGQNEACNSNSDCVGDLKCMSGSCTATGSAAVAQVPATPPVPTPAPKPKESTQSTGIASKNSVQLDSHSVTHLNGSAFMFNNSMRILKNGHRSAYLVFNDNKDVEPPLSAQVKSRVFRVIFNCTNSTVSPDQVSFYAKPLGEGERLYEGKIQEKWYSSNDGESINRAYGLVCQTASALAPQAAAPAIAPQVIATIPNNMLQMTEANFMVRNSIKDFGNGYRGAYFIRNSNAHVEGPLSAQVKSQVFRVIFNCANATWSNDQRYYHAMPFGEGQRLDAREVTQDKMTWYTITNSFQQQEHDLLCR